MLLFIRRWAPSTSSAKLQNHSCRHGLSVPVFLCNKPEMISQAQTGNMLLEYFQCEIMKDRGNKTKPLNVYIYENKTGGMGVKRVFLVLLALFLIPVGACCEQEDDLWIYWEESGLSDACEIKDGILTVFDGITALGYAATYYWDDEKEIDIEIEPKFEDGPSIDVWECPEVFHRAVLPSSLQYLGIEAFIGCEFEDFTLPAQLKVMEFGAMYYCSFDVLRIEAVLPLEEIAEGLYDCSVCAYEVPEDHPLYKTVDGVLFSKDGKTLILYPNGKKDTHYDVPAGVERIGKRAISCENLKTISLPIGLKSIADYGFAGCTRLQAIALPLTVNEIGREIFGECISLELVSMPEGLKAEKDESGTWGEYYSDDTIFRGDNGNTQDEGRGFINAPGRLCGRQNQSEPGTSDDYVWGYETSEAKDPVRSLRKGTIVYMGLYRDGRVAVHEPLGSVHYEYWDSSMLGWVDLADVCYLYSETLFEYADIQPQSIMNVWESKIPDSADAKRYKREFPMDGRTYFHILFGPFIRFFDYESYTKTACVIQDAELTRKPDGTANQYGIVYNADFMKDVPLLEERNGQILKLLIGGTQVQILCREDNWIQVTDGKDIGWITEDYMKIIPEKLLEVE